MKNKMMIACIVLFMLASIAGAQTPVIDGFSPGTGPVNTTVVIVGSGFAPSGNIIIFRNTLDGFVWEYRFTADSSDGITLTFTVPPIMNPACYYVDPPCAAPSKPTTTGQYEVFVLVASVASNIMIFNVSEGLPASARGDVNGDGRVNIIDAMMIAQYYVGIIPVNFNPLVADVDGNGKITIVDALVVARYYVGLGTL